MDHVFHYGPHAPPRAVFLLYTRRLRNRLPATKVERGSRRARARARASSLFATYLRPSRRSTHKLFYELVMEQSAAHIFHYFSHLGCRCVARRAADAFGRGDAQRHATPLLYVSKSPRFSSKRDCVSTLETTETIFLH